MKKRRTVKLPDGREISLFAARRLYRKTQYRIALNKFRIRFNELRIVRNELRILIHYLFVCFKMFVEGFGVPQGFQCRVPQLQKIYNAVKVVFWCHRCQSDAKNPPPSSGENTPLQPLENQRKTDVK